MCEVLSPCGTHPQSSFSENGNRNFSGTIIALCLARFLRASRPEVKVSKTVTHLERGWSSASSLPDQKGYPVCRPEA